MAAIKSSRGQLTKHIIEQRAKRPGAVRRRIPVWLPSPPLFTRMGDRGPGRSSTAQTGPNQAIEDSGDQSLFVQKLKIEGHDDLTMTADPLSKVYPYCIGQSVWTAAVELVDFLSSIPDEAVAGMTGGNPVLELGAGLGAVGMALARKGAADVVLTDKEVMLPLLQYNVATNFSDAAAGSRVRVAELSWGNKEQLEELLAERSFGMIVGADVAYDEDSHAPLLSTISECLAKNPAAKVVLSIPDRPESRQFLPRSQAAGLSWRILRRAKAESSPDLDHDCLILELFPNYGDGDSDDDAAVASAASAAAAAPSLDELRRGAAAVSPSSSSSRGTALICDFDWSLVEENSDTFVLEQLGAIHFLHRLQGAGEESWTRVMDGSLVAARHELGATETQVRAACRKTPMDPAVADALRKVARSSQTEGFILSDANSVFISEILSEKGSSSLPFKNGNVFTNPAAFDDSGALRVKPYHAAPPGCPLCPDNLCKGAVLEKLLMVGRYRRIVYVGDGGNDFCPSCRTGPSDVILARRSYPDGRPGRLLAKLQRASEQQQQNGTGPLPPVPLVAGRVVPWESAPELAGRILEFAAAAR